MCACINYTDSFRRQSPLIILIILSLPKKKKEKAGVNRRQSVTVAEEREIKVDKQIFPRKLYNIC